MARSPLWGAPPPPLSHAFTCPLAKFKKQFKTCMPEPTWAAVTHHRNQVAQRKQELASRGSGCWQARDNSRPYLGTACQGHDVLPVASGTAVIGCYPVAGSPSRPAHPDQHLGGFQQLNLGAGTLRRQHRGPCRPGRVESPHRWESPCGLDKDDTSASSSLPALPEQLWAPDRAQHSCAACHQTGLGVFYVYPLGGAGPRLREADRSPSAAGGA